MITYFRFGWLEYFLKSNLIIRLWQFIFGILFLHSRQISYYIFTRVNFKSSDIILDIGCGDGNYSNWISYYTKAHVVGIDRLENRIKNAKKVASFYKLKNEFIHGDIEVDSINFLSEKFDKILLIDVLEHLQEPAVIIKKCVQWLKPDGVLIISTPNISQKRWFNGNDENHFSYGADHHYYDGFTVMQIQDFFKKNGFTKEIKNFTIFFTWYQYAWEISEKIRCHSSSLYRILVPFLHPFLILDRRWPMSKQGNGLMFITTK
jgi:2-polyprenyl-3-methyl-5-hydroxy-6-metoxy-1,4-benzoquinol methylase